MESARMPLSRLYFSPEGRITRSTYWLYFYLPLFVLSIIAAGLDYAMGTFNETWGFGVFGGTISVLCIYPFAVACIKRLHDRGHPGWIYILLLVPLVNLWPAIEIGFLRGTVGPNDYGPDPLEEGARAGQPGTAEAGDQLHGVDGVAAGALQAPPGDTVYATANICLVCRKPIAVLSHHREVTFEHDSHACVGNVHEGCAEIFRHAIAGGRVEVLYATNFGDGRA